MSAHLVLRATVGVGEQYSVQIQVDYHRLLRQEAAHKSYILLVRKLTLKYVQRLAYPIRTLELVMAIPLSESATQHLKYWPMTHACGPLVGMATAHPTAAMLGTWLWTGSS